MSMSGESERPRIRVLLVDDQQLVRTGFRMILADEPDIEVVGEAADGRAALEQVAAERPQLILLDLMMPRMDGFEFVQELHKLPEGHSIPVVVITAKDITLEDRLRLNGYVEKIVEKGAYSRDDLLNTVKEMVEVSVRGRSQGAAKLPS